MNYFFGSTTQDWESAWWASPGADARELHQGEAMESRASFVGAPSCPLQSFGASAALEMGDKKKQSQM